MFDVRQELKDVISRLDDESIPYALCGGLAMAVHGYARATADIDIMVMGEDLARLETAVRPLGFDFPARPRTFHGGVVDIRRVSKVIAGQALPLNSLLVTPALQPIWDTREAMEWEFGKITVVSRNGLISLKSLRGTSRDQVDIKRLRGEGE